MTTTHTHTIVHFANPFLRCDVCGEPVVGYINALGHDEHLTNHPCRHIGITSVCPSWGPVDGCECPTPRDHGFGST